MCRASSPAERPWPARGYCLVWSPLEAVPYASSAHCPCRPLWSEPGNYDQPACDNDSVAPDGAEGTGAGEAARPGARPPRLPEQPIPNPVLNEDCAIKIARDWERQARLSWLTRFEVETAFLARYLVQQAGGRTILELCGFPPRNSTISMPTSSARPRRCNSHTDRDDLLVGGRGIPVPNHGAMTASEPSWTASAPAVQSWSG